MICPFCNANDDKVIDSRSSDGGKIIRRRRQCIACERRFTTYERIEHAARLFVIKRDGRRVPFNADNILRGLESACGKRSVSAEDMRRVVEQVEDEVHSQFDREVPSSIIGEHVMAKLRALDPIVLIRYASSYYTGWNMDDIEREIAAINSAPPEAKNQQELF